MAWIFGAAATACINDRRQFKKPSDYEEKDDVFITNLGILANGYYIVDIEAESIYGNIEVRTGVLEFSVGNN